MSEGTLDATAPPRRLSPGQAATLGHVTEGPEPVDVALPIAEGKGSVPAETHGLGEEGRKEQGEGGGQTHSAQEGRPSSHSFAFRGGRLGPQLG